MATPSINKALHLEFYDTQLEQVFSVFSAKKYRDTSLWVHCLVTEGWAIGTVKTLMLTFEENRFETKNWLLTQYVLLLGSQMIALFTFIGKWEALRSRKPLHCLLHSRIKTQRYAISALPAMLGTLVGRNYLSFSPSPTYIALSLLALADKILLKDLIWLHSVLWSLLFITECMIGQGARQMVVDLSMAFILGLVAPLVIAAVIEGKERLQFLKDLGKPINQLSPFWVGINGIRSSIWGM